MLSTACTLAISVSLLCSSLFLPICTENADKPSALEQAGKQDWGYVDVRPDAHMFWWLFETHHSSGAEARPLVMWLQGGPGCGSTGFGNFELIGPLDLNLEPRNTSWVKEASLLFVDNPVGSGFSYVDVDSAYAENIEEIADDLTVLITAFLKGHPKFKTVPFYVFGESYGGKMAAAFAHKLYQSVRNDDIECDFRGFAMGDSWISPVDSTLAWAPLLLQMSLVDQEGHDAILDAATSIETAVLSRNWENASMRWMEAVKLTTTLTSGVDFYNVLRLRRETSRQKRDLNTVGDYQPVLSEEEDGDSPLTTLMQGPVRRHLVIIPGNVTYKDQSSAVLEHQRVEFMKPVYQIVSDLLEQTDLHVVVYQGQLDLICPTMGALRWTQRMDWSGLENYNRATRQTLRNPDTNQVEMFVKEYDNFQFYWVLGGGHLLAKDQPEITLRLLQNILALEGG